MSSSAPQPGLPVLEKYELLEEIGHGGMATVYRARDPRLNREVAVKVIHKHLRENGEVATRFVAEARAAAKLRHRNIVEVFDVSNEDDPERYLVVELLRGCTLRKILVEHRDMPAEIGAAVALELCEALDHAHDQGIIHRDIKPENVLIEQPKDREAFRNSDSPGAPTPANDSVPQSSEPPVVFASSTPSDTQASVVPAKSTDRRKPRKPSERPARKPKAEDNDVVIKITDFGIAKMLDAQGVTSTGQVLGSPAHMAPEQIEGGDVDARTDVFALGVLLYECLVGHLPFEGKNPAQVLKKVLDGTYPAPDRERPEVGGRWAKIVAQSLARNPDERTKSPSALSEQIRAELVALGIDEPRAEISRYFLDPKGYTKKHSGRIVQRILARGEAARKAGDIPGAASDFNRAVALAPNDPSILRRLTSLNSSRSRRAALLRVGLIALGSALLGLVAFGLARVVRHRAEARALAERTVTTADPNPSASANDPRVAVAPTTTATLAPILADSGRPRLRPPIPLNTIPVPTSTSDALPADSGLRKVIFAISPNGASLTLDGEDKHDTWLGKTFTLRVGTHAVNVNANSPCCKPRSTSIRVDPAPEGSPDAVQTIPLGLDLNPAQVSLAGPPGGVVKCGFINLVLGVGESQSLKIDQPERRGTCEFQPLKGDPIRGPARVKAGETNMIAWPG